MMGERAKSWSRNCPHCISMCDTCLEGRSKSTWIVVDTRRALGNWSPVSEIRGMDTPAEKTLNSTSLAIRSLRQTVAERVVDSRQIYFPLAQVQHPNNESIQYNVLLVIIVPMKNVFQCERIRRLFCVCAQKFSRSTGILRYNSFPTGLLKQAAFIEHCHEVFIEKWLIWVVQQQTIGISRGQKTPKTGEWFAPFRMFQIVAGSIGSSVWFVGADQVGVMVALLGSVLKLRATEISACEAMKLILPEHLHPETTTIFFRF